MQLPSSISPCPIKESVCGIRFKANVPDEAVFGIVYQSLKQDFQKVQQLPIMALPAEMRSTDKDLIFQPYFRLQNEELTVLVGPKTITVGMRGNYPGWQKHSSQIKTILMRFHKTGIVEKILRMGLRYISFFDFDIFPKLLLQVTIEDKRIEGDETYFRTILRHQDCDTLLQIQKGVALQQNPGKTGSVIDIDCFLANFTSEFEPALNDFLEKAHTSEKERFFELLKPDFLKTLNPKYE